MLWRMRELLDAIPWQSASLEQLRERLPNADIPALLARAQREDLVRYVDVSVEETTGTRFGGGPEVLRTYHLTPKGAQAGLRFLML
jgi:hypothetical protein